MGITFGFIEVVEKDSIPDCIWKESIEPTLKKFFNLYVSKFMQKQHEYIESLNPREIEKFNIPRRGTNWNIVESSQGDQSWIAISDDDQFPYNRTFLVSKITKHNIRRTVFNGLSLVDTPHIRLSLALYQLTEILASEYVSVKAWGFYGKVVPFNAFTGTDPCILDFLPFLPSKIQANFVKNTFLGESEG